MISHQHKTLFVHVPKVAGQSIESMFLASLGLDWKSREALLLRKKKSHEKGPERLAHLTARQYVALGYVDEQTFNGYFKFSFVRNPYKRVFSAYNFLGYSKVISFKTFVLKVLPLKLKKKDFFFLSAYDYLFNEEGKLMVDFVGRLEHIDEDIEKVISQSKLGEIPLPHVNKSKGGWKRAIKLLVREPYLLAHLGFGNNGSFDEQCTEPLKKEIVKWYQKDFEAFQYKK